MAGERGLERRHLSRVTRPYPNLNDRSPANLYQPWAASEASAVSTCVMNLVHIESEISTFPALAVYLVVIGDIETRLSQDQ